MRHGANIDSNILSETACCSEGIKSIPGNELGCYFCNDITAPGNVCLQYLLLLETIKIVYFLVIK